MIKVNAILNDASNETFFNKEVARALGLSEPFEFVKAHVLKDEVGLFRMNEFQKNVIWKYK